MFQNSSCSSVGRHTGLWEAAASGNASRAQRLMTGTRPQSPNQLQHGFTPVYLATIENHATVLKVMRKAANPNISCSGETPLFAAARLDFVSCAEQLIEMKANVNLGRVVSGVAESPLSLAARGGHIAMVRLLLAHNADPRRSYPVHSALCCGQVKTALLVLRSLLLTSDLAVCHGDASPLEHKGPMGFPPAIPPASSYGRYGKLECTALFAACSLHLLNPDLEEELLDVLDLLLSLGADTNAWAVEPTSPRDKDSERRPIAQPLHAALRIGEECVALRLLQQRTMRDADNREELSLDEHDEHGFLPLHLACRRGYFRAAALLMDRFPRSVNSLTRFGAATPLSLALNERHVNCAVALLNHGADLYDARLETSPFEIAKAIGLQAEIEECYQYAQRGLSGVLTDPSLDCFADLMFVVQDARMPCSRAVIETRCPSLARVVDIAASRAAADGHITEPLEVMIDPAVAPPVFRKLLHFIYSDNIRLDQNDTSFDMSNFPELLNLSEEYELVRLRAICQAFLERAESDAPLASFLPAPTLSHDLAKLVGNDRHSDIEFLPSDDGVPIPAHKVILAARVDYFRAMLTGPWMMGKGRSSVPVECGRDAFEHFIRYCYTGVCDLDGDNVVELYELGHRYLLAELRRQAKGLIVDAICVENVVDVYGLACYYDDRSLASRCVEFMLEGAGTPDERMSDIASRPEFSTLKPATLVPVYAQLVARLGKFDYVIDKVDPKPETLLNLRNAAGLSPLDVAVRHPGTEPLLQFLLEAGADPFGSGKDGTSTPLGCAVERGSPTAVELLISRISEDLLLNELRKPVDKFKNRLLHRACLLGHVRVAELLLEYNAPVTLANAYGQSAMDLLEPHHADRFSTIVSKACVRYDAVVDNHEVADVAFLTDDGPVLCNSAILLARCPGVADLLEFALEETQVVERPVGTHEPDIMAGYSTLTLKKVELLGASRDDVLMFLEMLLGDQCEVTRKTCPQLWNVALIFGAERVQSLCELATDAFFADDERRKEQQRATTKADLYARRLDQLRSDEDRISPGGSDDFSISNGATRGKNASSNTSHRSRRSYGMSLSKDLRANICSAFNGPKGCKKGVLCPKFHVRYDTAIPCKYHLKDGACRLGAKCKFSHDARFNECIRGQAPTTDTVRKLAARVKFLGVKSPGVDEYLPPPVALKGVWLSTQELSSDMRKMYASKSDADVSFVWSSPPGILSANRVVLSVRCPKLLDIFPDLKHAAGKARLVADSSHMKIRMDDVGVSERALTACPSIVWPPSLREFDKVLLEIYCGRAHIPKDASEVEQLKALATFLELDYLTSKCEYRVQSGIMKDRRSNILCATDGA